MWLNQDFTCTFTHICYFYSGSTIHIYPPISISRTTQKYSTPNPVENSQKYFCFPLWNKYSSYLVTTTCYIISRDECSNKNKERYEKIKRSKCSEPRKERKRVRQEVKMDKCPTVELGVQDTHLREKKKYRASHSPHKVTESKEGMYPLKEQK